MSVQEEESGIWDTSQACSLPFSYIPRRGSTSGRQALELTFRLCSTLSTSPWLCLPAKPTLSWGTFV